MKRSMQPLPHVSFSIMMALSLRPRHGYEIMQQVEEDTQGKVKLGPGSLYGAMKQLSENGYIEEVPGETERRRHYRLTRKGWLRLSADLEYFANMMRLAKQRKAFEGIRGAAI